MKDAENTMAFPKLQHVRQELVNYGGLTKLEYFTAAALTGILANPDARNIRIDEHVESAVAVEKKAISLLYK